MPKHPIDNLEDEAVTMTFIYKQTLKWLAASSLLLTSHLCAGQWVEASGGAQIRSGNKEEARSMAVQNAVKDALLFAGASVTSVQQVSDGLLTQDHFKVSAHGSIQQIELVDEVHSNGVVNVTIRADIIPEQRQCFNSEFRKSIAITQFGLNNREQAKIGGIYAIGKQFSNKLFHILKQQSGQILPRPWYQQKLSNHGAFEQYYEHDLGVVDTIASSSESQFILFGQITDVSFGDQTSNDLAFWQDTAHERFFSVEWMLYNTSSKEQIARDAFDTQGEWSFNQRHRVDIKSRKFWRSDYGSTVTQAIEQVRTSIEEIVNCQPLQGKIMRVTGNQIQFNLGTEHGITKGQTFSIIQQAHFTTEDGKHLPQFVVSPYKVKVTDVYNRSAVAFSVDGQLLSNIQTTDFVTIEQIDEFNFD